MWDNFPATASLWDAQCCPSRAVGLLPPRAEPGPRREGNCCIETTTAAPLSGHVLISKVLNLKHYSPL